MSIETPVTTPATLPAAVQLRTDIKSGVDAAQQSGTIRTRVIGKLVEDAVKDRVDVLAKALAKREEKQKEIDNLKPDHKLRDATGKMMTEAYTEATYKKREKLVKELSKMDKVINQAINEGNYDGARKLAGGSLPTSDEGEGDESSES